ncbi:LuxR family transcriptional regulator [Actinomadura sp. WMMB 499]|uniref:helix-turn-helix transcriptional regulator n=1 Tax=Actinomadura sp. WMMB 499 TaxID=1219491 RepID=UPI001246F228|nr:LuxR family transcriptional regulator [Actinomadura sp. WMMB 499]QFG21437.1 AAA family ATPase [Actinomadura sp. WMMB 499]
MPIVERTEEMSRLDAVFAGSRAGHGAVFLVEGPAGTGKTRLVHEFGERAVEAGATFLSAAASRADHGFPLSAAGRLFGGPALRAAQLEEAERLLEEGAAAADPGRSPSGGPVGGAAVPAEVLRGLGALLLSAADRAPLVIAVDDVHHADPASLRFLHHLVRRAGSARIMLVLTECVRAAPPSPLPHAELLRGPRVHRARLRTLTRDGVAAVLSGHFDPLTVRRLAGGWHRATGGNPLLVHALVEDHRASEAAHPPELVFGEAFRRAVLTCLQRCEAMPLARGLAVLPPRSSGPGAGELVGLDARAVALTGEVLAATGLTATGPTATGPTATGGGFRHEAVRAAVLGGMRADRRRALRLRAAELLHRAGAPAAEIADRLVAADRVPGPWALAVLREASGPISGAAGRPETVARLRLALRGRPGEPERAAILFDLACAEWQADPERAIRHLPELSAALRAGHLPPDAAGRLAAWAMWLGRVDDARELDGAGAAPGTVERRLARAFPGLAPSGDGTEPAPPGTARPGPAAPPTRARASRGSAVKRSPARPPAPRVPAENLPSARGVRAVAEDDTLLGTFVEFLTHPALHEDEHRVAVAHIEHVLGERASAPGTCAPVAALAALVHVGEVERAEHWCDALERSDPEPPPLMAALYLVARALIRSRRGDLNGVVEHVLGAFDLVPPGGFGVFAGIPMGVLVEALVARGEHVAAGRWLDRPLPDATLHSPFVLPFLRARGEHHLVVGRARTAAAEFRLCGHLMRTWGCDLPGFVPWRTDLARAYLAVGDAEPAARLVREEIRRLPDGRTRPRAGALRVLAAAVPDERTRTLRQAARAAERAGDRLELARVLAGLAACHRTERPHRARELERRAAALAAECGAAGIGRHLGPGAPAERAGTPAPGADRFTELSDAERRVAALAAEGWSNRQIAKRLHVTTSTVEQHLTRVYRKLRINRRTDLPLDLAGIPLRGFLA